MLPHTLDKHLSFGYGPGIFNPEDKSSENQLWCAYSRAKAAPEGFVQECTRTARLISEQCKAIGRRPIIGLSGGMDSEVTVKSFLAAGVDFDILTFRFEDGLNEHEMKFVRDFCGRHGLVPKYLDIDIKSWAPSEDAKRIFDQSQAFSMLPHMKLMNHIWFELGGAPVLGNGDIYFENVDASWKYVELEYMLAWFRHAIKNGILGSIAFFQHTPEVMLSMLREPRIERLGLNKDVYATRIYETSRFIKYSIYKKYWPDLLMRPKFGGQEMVEELYANCAARFLSGRQMLYNDKVMIPYDALRSMLEPSA